MKLSKPLAFLKKDFLEDVSYRFAFVFKLLSIFFRVIIFFFIARLFGGAIAPHLKPFGGDYFSFVIIGIAFSDYLHVSLTGFSANIRSQQLMGTLEAVLVTPTKISTIVLSSSLYSFVFSSVRVLIFIALGAVLSVYVSGGSFVSGGNFAGALVILLLTIVSFCSLGILSASFLMVFKRGDPLSTFFSMGSYLLGGVYYPPEVLPPWIASLSFLFPITYSLHGIRLCLLQGASLWEVKGDVYPLIIFSAILLPISVWVFKKALHKAKMDGSLTQY